MGKTTEKNDSKTKDELDTSTNVEVEKTSEVTKSDDAVVIEVEEVTIKEEAEKVAEAEPKLEKSEATEAKKAKKTEEPTESVEKPTEDNNAAKTSETKEANTKEDEATSTQKTEDTKASNDAESTTKVKPKSKAVVLAPIKDENAKEVSKETKANKIESTTTKTTTKKSKSNKAQVAEGGKTTNSSKNQDLKLPLFRRIHVKIGYIITGIIVILLVAFFGRVALWEHDYLERMEGSERHTTATSNTAIGDDGEEVDTTEPTEVEIREYIVAADKPRYFSIPSLGIYNARIIELGVKDNGELATPWNIYDMGWYTGSALPGELGVSMFDGHGGDIGYGVLKTLPRIAIGAIIKVEMGDGRVFNYRVVDTAVKAIGDEANDYMATAFSTPDGARSSLSIITCTGDYWQYSQTYSHRFFLRAVLEN